MSTSKGRVRLNIARAAQAGRAEKSIESGARSWVLRHRTELVAHRVSVVSVYIAPDNPAQPITAELTGATDAEAARDIAASLVQDITPTELPGWARATSFKAFTYGV